MDGKETNSRGIDAGHDYICPNVALVAEQVLLEHSHDCDNTRGPAGGERVKLKAGGDQGCSKLGVGCGPGTGAEDGRRDVVQFFTILSKDSVSSSSVRLET